MLDNIDSIDWSNLVHAFGVATDIPEQLRALASKDKKKREDALWKLYGNIFHEGKRYPATPYAVPFLYELVSNPNIGERNEIIYLLVNLALGYEEVYLLEGFASKKFRLQMEKASSDLSQNKRSNLEKYGYGPQVDIACYDAVLEGVPVLIKLLGDQDVNVRRAAVYALAWFPEAANESIGKLVRLLEMKSDDLSIANILLTIGLLAKQSENKNGIPDLRGYLSNEKPLIVRMAASIAQSSVPLKEEYIAILVEAIVNPDVLQIGNKLPFNKGNLAGYASLILSRSDKSAHAQIIPALCESLRLTDAYQSLDITQALLNMVITDRTVPIKKIPVTSLNSLQIMAFTAIAEHGGWEIDRGVFTLFYCLVRMYGLPGSRIGLIKYLAIN